MKKFLSILFLLALTNTSIANEDFNAWVKNFIVYAKNQGISNSTLDASFKNVKFLENIIKSDRKQPEFIEKTDIYISKRVNPIKVITAKKIIKDNIDILNKIEKKFKVPKEYIVALWGVETVFGVHKGKVDIISALATLSFDKRRSEYFRNELLVLLKLIDKKVVKLENLKGSWAGAHGNFQFMPTSIMNYAIDYNKDGKIDLYYSLEDSFASAANYLKTIGWDKNPWGIKVKVTKKIPTQYISYDARELKKELNINQWEMLGIEFPDNLNINKKTKGKLIYPDGDDSLAYIVFKNYERLLHWNRSLRFAICIGVFSDLVKS